MIQTLSVCTWIVFIDFFLKVLASSWEYAPMGDGAFLIGRDASTTSVLFVSVIFLGTVVRVNQFVSKGGLIPGGAAFMSYHILSEVCVW